MKIFLIRHGQTAWNEQGRIQGHADIPLNEKGIEQLEAAGRCLAGLGEPIDAIIASPLQRAQKSAWIVAGFVGYDPQAILTEEGFTELDSGMAEGLTARERQERYPEVVPGMETHEELCRRVRNAFSVYLDRYWGKNMVIVSHVGTIKAIIEVATKGAIPYSVSQVPVGNGSVTQLEYAQELQSLSWYDFEAGCMKQVGWA